MYAFDIIHFVVNPSPVVYLIRGLCKTKLRLNVKEEDASVCLLFDLAGIKYEIEEVCTITSQFCSKSNLTPCPAW